MLRHLQNKSGRSSGNCDFESIKNWWQSTVKLHVNDGTNNLSYDTSVY